MPSIRIPLIHIHSRRISSRCIHSIHILSKSMHQQEWQCILQNIHLYVTYPCNTQVHTYPFHAYPFNTYPFTRYTSAGMAMYVSRKHIFAYHCISRNGNEYEYHYMSFHPIATRREWQQKYKHFFSFNILPTLLIGNELYRARMNMDFIASYWPACLLACLLFACAFAF